MGRRQQHEKARQMKQTVVLHKAPDHGQYAEPTPERFLDSPVGKRFQGQRSAQVDAEKVLVRTTAT